MKLSEELKWRGYINQTTLKDIAYLDDNKLTFYWGVDPSASSMTVGQLSLIMMIRLFIKAGHKPVLLVGGATGLIGDPDGKTQERDLKTSEEINYNVQSITSQYERLFNSEKITVVNNYDWFKNFGYLDFLRKVGKHVPMRQMLGREFVQSRLSENGAGISYAEFSYSLIQGYDFLHLYEELGVTLQVCGADQWGNCIAGVDLVRRIKGGEAHIWSAPLVINKSTGIKFGKTEEGAIWLDEKQTSPYNFYQFWFNSDDDSVLDYLKLYTLTEKNEYDELITKFNNDRGSRIAQKTLAYEVTKIVHGEKIANAIIAANEILFGKKDFDTLSNDEVDQIKNILPNYDVQDNLLDTIVNSGLAKSKTEAMTFVVDGAIRLNGEKITDASFAIKNSVNLLQRGKNLFSVVVKK